LKLQVAFGDGKFLGSLGNFRLGFHYVHRGNRFELQLLLGIFVTLLSEGKRLLVHAGLFVGIHEIPIDVLDLRHRLDDLVAEGNVGNLLVIPGDPEVSEVRSESKSCQEFLPNAEPILRVQRWIQVAENTIRRLTIVIKSELETCTRGKRL